MTICDGRETLLGKTLSIPAPPELITFLISCGLRPSRVPFDVSPLGLACGRWQTRFVELCTVLIQHGASLLHFGALAEAEKNGQMDTMSWLLEHGAEVNDIVTNAALITHPCKGHSLPVLHAAIESEHENITRLLLDHGAVPGLFDKKGRTAFAVAEAKGNQQMLNLVESSGTARSIAPGSVLGFPIDLQGVRKLQAC